MALPHWLLQKMAWTAAPSAHLQIWRLLKRVLQPHGKRIVDFILVTIVCADVRGVLVKHALLTVSGRPVGFWSSDQGEFWRMLRPGAYMVVASAPGYLPASAHFTVAEGERWAPPVVITLHLAPRSFPVLQISAPTMTHKRKNRTSRDNQRVPSEGAVKTGLPSTSTKVVLNWQLRLVLLLLVFFV
ncbi:hypothetical protein MRX96_034977 [Rhipicephalus microplus]